jgi:glycosyltransferase involved in cell wall biosynthesis
VPPTTDPTAHHDPPARDVSVVIPVYNERENLRPLTDDVRAALGGLGRSHEILYVNDGSTDGSGEVLDAIAAEHAEVKVIHFAHNCGQTLAIAAGMDAAGGRAIVLMDGDRQNDPADIGRLLAVLDEGHECVSGWRRDRQDGALRRVVSRVANRIINGMAGVPIHDLGCTLKAYRAEAIDPRELFGEMHRFLPVIVASRGGRVAELVVKHHPRAAGVSKYGFGRACRVISDIALTRVLLKYRTRPSHLFAYWAQLLVLGGGGVFALSVVLDIVTRWWLWPLGFLTAVVAGVGAVVLVAVGIACELVMRNRYWLSGRPPWAIARTVNFDEARHAPDSSAAPAESPARIQ